MDETVRFGIAGTGRISDWVLKGALEDPRFKAVAVCSRSLGRAREYIASHPEAFGPDAKAYDSIEDMASDPEIDAVYVGTPNNTHLHYTLASLERGKHVLCEKPLGCSVPEVEQMIAASRGKGLVLMEAMISTLNPNFLKAKALMPEIGPVRSYVSSFCQYSSKYEALQKGVMASCFDPRCGGGAMVDIGIYTVYPAVVLFGAPERIGSEVVRYDTPYGKTDIQGSVILRYPGMTAALTYSKVADSVVPTEISGEKGSLVMEQVHICRKAEYIRRGTPKSLGGKPSERSIIGEGLPHDPYFYEFEEFISLVNRNKAGEPVVESAINSHSASLETERIMETALRL